MQMRKAINLIIVLLVILIALLVAILVISNRISSGGGDQSSNTTDSPKISTSTPDDTKTPPDTTTADSKTDPPATSEPEKTTDSDTKKPDVTETTGGNVPDGFRLNKTVTSETGTPLNIRADVRGEKDAATGKVKLTVLLYLDYRSLQLGERKNCRLSLGDSSESFNLPAISEEDSSEHSLFIASAELYCDYGETVSLYARVPFRGTYSDVEISSLEIDTDITVK